MDRYNFVLIFKGGEVPELPESKRKILIHESEQGWKCAHGSWNKADIEKYEYYDSMSNWVGKSGWRDIPL